jgi:hypothetical protein
MLAFIRGPRGLGELMRSSVVLIIGLALVGPRAHAEPLMQYLDSPRYKTMRAADLDEEIARLRYVNCLADEAERIGGGPKDWADVAEKIHGRCPAQAATFWAAHDRARQAAGAPSIDEDRSGLAHELNGALYGVMHKRLDEAEARRFDANLELRSRAGSVFGECMHNAALKADDHVSKPADIAPRIVDACPDEELRAVEADIADEPADVVTRYRADHEANRLQRAVRDVEIAREQPHYYDGE